MFGGFESRGDKTHGRLSCFPQRQKGRCQKKLLSTGKAKGKNGNVFLDMKNLREFRNSQMVKKLN